MDQRELDRVWDRARRGLHTVVVGSLPAAVEPPEDLLVLRVRCDVPPRLLGPLLDAAQRAARLMGEPPPRLDAGDALASDGARGRLLDPGLLEPRAVATVVSTLNRLARRVTRGGAVLVFDQLAAADEATVAALRAVLERPGWLALPVVLALGTAEPPPATLPLLDAVVARAGREALVRAAAPATDETDWREAFARLPSEVKLTLRAASLIGVAFEPATVAALRGVAAARVLEHLQQAADEGVPIEDGGAEHVHLPGAMAAALRETMLPSLARAWHRRLAQLLAGDTPAERAAAPAATSSAPALSRAPLAPPAQADAGAPTTPAREPATALDPPVRRAPPRIRLARPRPGLVAAPASPPPRVEPRPAYAELFEVSPEASALEPARAPGAAPSLAAAPAADAASARAGVVPLPTPASAGDAAAIAPGVAHARAAEHLIATGELDAAAERFAAAAVDAAETGLPAQAFAYGRRALDTLARLPDNPARRRLRIEILCALGQLQWQSAGPGTDFTLAAAVATLESARRLIAPDDPAELRALVLSQLAAARYELGDLRSLSTALDELSDAVRLLVAAGDAPAAARLLNDQAAVYVRLGDPVRATYLLEESRRVFEARAASDPTALYELAETDHLFARLPLHVAARPGREADALEMARRHASAAEQVYRRMGAVRELARVWETMARIELRAGHPERAEERLAGAVQAQESLGDVLGLARSTAALAEALARTGRLPEALELQGSSVAFNLEKGSPIGLAYNRRALERLGGAAVETGAQAAHRAALEQLAAAEQIVGRAELRAE